MLSVFSNLNPAVILTIIIVLSVVSFLTIWFLMGFFYLKASCKWSCIERFIDRSRGKGESPMIKKYGLFGLALLIAIPLPTMGVFGGTILSWLMGMKFWSSLVAIISGVTVSNSIVLFSTFGVIKAIGFFG
jgi:uncharacterized membrane protein